MSVVMKITMTNETGKYYFSMDEGYTVYTGEIEVLLLQGIVAEITHIETRTDTERAVDYTYVELLITEKRQERDRCIKLAIFIPLFLMWQFSILYVPFGFFQ